MILDRTKGARLWLTLILVAGLPRILAAFLLPNAFGDAYAYIGEVTKLTTRISEGTFTLTDLYGFWLPLYQLICALVSAVVGHPFQVARLVPAVCGLGICLLVYDISLRLTSHRSASLLTFALIALSPLHVFNSASAMTDVPNAFLVLASAFFVLRRRWVLAAILGALAGLTRVDSWLLILLIPGLQLFTERRISVTAGAILIFPPLFWFYISWQATGNWLACFVARKEYMDALFIANPSLASFSWSGIARDGGALLFATDSAVLAACFIAGGVVIKQMMTAKEKHRAEAPRAVLVLTVFFFAALAFIVLAYLTHKQPIIFPRYGLLLFAQGVPLLPWAFLRITRRRPELARGLLAAVISVCLLNAGAQLTYAVGYINREYAHAAIATQLQSRFRADSDARFFCDDGTVAALSEIPAARLHTSIVAPRDREGFLAYLKQKNVKYLVFLDRQDSTPARLFPELKNGIGNDAFRPVAHARSGFLPTEIWLYRAEP